MAIKNLNFTPRNPWLAFVLLIAGLLSAGCGRDLASATLIVTNGTVIDGTGADPIPDGWIAVQDDRILAVGRSQEFILPEGVEIVDAGGGTILPGIINAHAHKVSGPGTRRILFLLDGVTSVCDMMISQQMMADLDEEGIQDGPAARGFKSGPMVTAPGGYPGVMFGAYNSYEVVGEVQAAQAVDDLFDLGADYIKMALEPGIFGAPWPVLSVQEVSAAVQAAHEHGLLVRAHVSHTALEVALAGGVDVIEHVAMPSFSADELATMSNGAGEFQIPDKLEEQLLQMVEQGIILVPTLDAIISDAYIEGGLTPDEEIVADAVLAVVRFFHQSGGRIALGNDYGNSGVEPGMPLDEMEFLSLVGLSPMDVLVASTQNAAYVCGQGKELGTIERGKLADLIIVDGNPLSDHSALDSVLYVIKDGEVVVYPP